MKFYRWLMKRIGVQGWGRNSTLVKLFMLCGWVLLNFLYSMKRWSFELHKYRLLQMISELIPMEPRLIQPHYIILLVYFWHPQDCIGNQKSWELLLLPSLQSPLLLFRFFWPFSLGGKKYPDSVVLPITLETPSIFTSGF